MKTPHRPVAPTYRSVVLLNGRLSDLRTFDPETLRSVVQTGEDGYWYPNMLCSGPAGIGSNYTYVGFNRDHRIPFLTPFPNRIGGNDFSRIGGNHFSRFGDGDYVCSGGWPSMTRLGPYLGVAATGQHLTLRVMDFWWVDGRRIMENWAC